MYSGTQTTVAFFGATGGTANHALTLALQAGHHCTALARTPQKLIDMLVAASISRSIIESNLQIIKGDMRDIDAVKSTLSHMPIDMIVSGIGRTTLFKDVDSTICQDAAQIIIAALKELKLSKKPVFVAVSTTGISPNGRDIPVMMVPLYHMLLKSPHEDKKVMEQIVLAAAAEEDPVISSYTLIRPALFVDGKREPLGLERIIVGTETAPAIGYTISRKEVGCWIFTKLIAGDASEYRNQKPNLVTMSQQEIRKANMAALAGKLTK